MRFLKLLLFLLPVGFATAQTTNQCPLSGSASSTGASSVLDNRLKGCYNWRFTYVSTGFSALSIQVEGSPDNSTWTALTVVTGDGANPSTTITYATSGFHINPSFIRVNLTAATGTGLVNWQLTGTAGAAPTSVFGAGGGGGGGGGVVTQPWTVGTGGVTAGQLVCVSRTGSPATAITCTTTGVITNAQIDATIIGIAQTTVSAGGTVNVIVQGPATCTFDAINPVVAGHTANYSLSVNGDCQDSGVNSTNFGIPFVGVATTSGTGLQSIWVMGSGLFGSRNHPISPLRTTNPGGLSPENFQLQIATTTQTMQTAGGFATGTSLPLASGLFVVGDCVMVDSGGSNSLVDAGAPCGGVTSVSATAPVNSTGGTTPVISVTKVGTGGSLVSAAALGTAGNCANWSTSGIGDAGAPCGSGSGGVTSVSGTSPIASSGGTTPAISCATCTVTIASGTATLGTGAITSGTCATVVTVAGTGIATTDNIMADFNADPTSITGYGVNTAGVLTVYKYPTSGNVNFKVCNSTGGSVTPGAATLNWRVAR